MILLGQHGQRQDYTRGLEYIRLAAQSCDQNAPQGAYVSSCVYPSITKSLTRETGLWHASSSRTSSS